MNKSKSKSKSKILSGMRWFIWGLAGVLFYRTVMVLVIRAVEFHNVSLILESYGW